MNIQELFIPFGLYAAVIGVLFKVILNQHQRRMDERFVDLKKQRDNQDKRIDTIGERVTRIEEGQRHAPNHNDMKEINRTLARVAADNENQTNTLKDVTRRLTDIHNFLLNNK